MKVKDKEEEMAVEEYLLTLQPLFSKSAEFTTNYNNIMKREKKDSILRIPIIVNKGAKGIDYSRITESRISSLDSSSKNFRIAAGPLGEHNRLAPAGTLSPISEITRMKQQMKQGLQVPNQLNRNSHEVNLIRQKHATEHSDVESKKYLAKEKTSITQEINLPVIKNTTTSSVSARSIQRGNSTKLAPYFKRNNLNKFSPTKAKLLESRLKICFENKASKKVKNTVHGEDPQKQLRIAEGITEFMNNLVKGMFEIMREDGKKVLKDNENLISEVKGPVTERIFFWSKDMTMYGFATPEKVEQLLLNQNKKQKQSKNT